VRRVPPDVLRRCRALPLLADGDVMDVAFADPTDSRAVAALSKALGKRVRPAVATSTSILAALREVLGADFDKGTADHDDSWEASGAMRCYALLLWCVEQELTELQIVPVPGGGSVRVRRDGRLEERERLGGTEREALVARLKALAGVPPRSPAPRGETILRTTIGGRDLRLSIVFVPAVEGEAVFVAFRDAPTAGGTPPQGLSETEVDLAVAALRQGEGLIVVNDAREERALAFVSRLLAGLRRDVEHVVCVTAETAPSLERAMHVTARSFAGGLEEACAVARAALPDVLVIAPGAATTLPRDAVLLARDGHRVIWVAAWRDAAETLSALRRLDLPSGCAEASLRVVVTLREARPAAGGACVVLSEVVRLSADDRDRLASTTTTAEARRALEALGHRTLAAKARALVDRGVLASGAEGGL
jgi:general secretion pathway protein E